MNEEEFTRESTRARFHEFRRIYERIDETFLFGKISLELERIYPRGAIFLEKDWIREDLNIALTHDDDSFSIRVFLSENKCCAFLPFSFQGSHIPGR